MATAIVPGATLGDPACQVNFESLGGPYPTARQRHAAARVAPEESERSWTTPRVYVTSRKGAAWGGGGLVPATGAGAGVSGTSYLRSSSPDMLTCACACAWHPAPITTSVAMERRCVTFPSNIDGRASPSKNNTDHPVA